MRNNMSYKNTSGYKKVQKKRRTRYFYLNDRGNNCEKPDALIGKGAFGTTYRMKSRIDMGIYAVKHVARSVKSEVQTLVTLFHPNIIRYFSCELKKNKSMWIIMELIGNGTTIKDILFSSAYKHRKSIMLQISKALTYLHDEKNIIHRDIKSSNIFICGNRIVLGDFGHSVCLNENRIYKPSENINGESHLVYRAPEVLNGENYNAASDMYQLGCLFLEIMTHLTMDEIVGNSDKNGWYRTTYKWLDTTEAGETFQDILQDETDFCLSCNLKTILLLLDKDPKQRPKANQIVLIFSPPFKKKIAIGRYSIHQDNIVSPVRPYSV